MIDRTSCAGCDTPVVIGDLLDGPAGHVDRHPVVLDPAPYLVYAEPDPTLLLHLGVSDDTRRWLVVPLHEPAGLKAAQSMALPHAHRQHVCDSLPSGWAEEHALPGQRALA